MSSPSDMIINGIDLDCSKLTFSKPKVTATGGKSVNIINSASKKGLYLTTPLMLTWGIDLFSVIEPINSMNMDSMI